MQGLEAGDDPADAREQHGGRRASRAARDLRRHRQVRPQLGELPRHRGLADGARGQRDAGDAVRHAGGGVPDPPAGSARGDGDDQLRAAELAAFLRAAGRQPDDLRPVHRGAVGVHRHPGRDPGHLRDAAVGRQHPPRRLARGQDPAVRRHGRHGRQPAARDDDARRSRDLLRRRPADHRQAHGGGLRGRGRELAR